MYLLAFAVAVPASVLALFWLARQLSPITVCEKLHVGASLSEIKEALGEPIDRSADLLYFEGDPTAATALIKAQVDGDGNVVALWCNYEGDSSPTWRNPRR